MLDVEAALARVQAAAGLIPREAAPVIADAARAEASDWPWNPLPRSALPLFWLPC
jgi:adenylosuccinate lyase